ncbi:MAG: hypothetical protein WCZ29_08520 [Mycolicibacterium vanbaalenii]|uniref:hypothetical protein n=1 Tax=Mycolicibacterium vanbaalenii TaxID=110539 RepID=UPI0035621FE1
MGLLDDDRTEDLRPVNSDAARAATPTASEPTLTKNQIGDSIMSHENPFPVDSATRRCCGGIGRHTRDCSSENALDIDREQELLNQRLSHIPVPAGATTDGWFSIRSSDGDAMRSLEWSRHDTENMGVSVGGWQHEDGQISRHIGLFDIPDELTAEDARHLAAALVAAADALEGLQ